jgi:hypothetical protein
MTCLHVLGLIDAGPFVDFSRAQMEAALAHARECQTCRLALEASEALAGDLAALPQPAAPPGLAGSILAGIEAVDRARAAAGGEDQRARRPHRLPGLSDWSAWSTALGGSVAGLILVTSMPRVHEVLVTWVPTADNAMMTGWLEEPPGFAGGVVLAAGLLLFVVGLLASIGDRNRPDVT